MTGNMLSIMLLMGIGTGELLLIALVILLFFGAKKIPELMRSLGKRLRGFTDEMSEISEKKQETKKEEKSGDAGQR